MNQVGAKRLTILGEFLLKLHHSKFDLSHWVIGDDPDQMAEKPLEKGECGTSACAIGWLPALFPRTWAWTNKGTTLSAEIQYRPSPDMTATSHNGILRAAALFFSIDFEGAKDLFWPDSYSCGPSTTAKSVGWRILSVVKEAGY